MILVSEDLSFLLLIQVGKTWVAFQDSHSSEPNKRTKSSRCSKLQTFVVGGSSREWEEAGIPLRLEPAENNTSKRQRHKVSLATEMKRTWRSLTESVTQK